MIRWMLATDNSGHWYLIPAERLSDWGTWLDLDEDDEQSWEAPEFAKRIDGPHMMTFTDPQETQS